MTAVEWLVEQLEQQKFVTKSQIHIANKMEKQQQGYSEEDMTNYALYILHNDVITPKEWFNKFKNK
jgi:hypothetical protein